MKRFKIFGLLATIILAFASCETEVEDPAGLRGVGVVPVISNLNPAVYDSNDLENTFVQFTIEVEDPTVEEVVIVASFNGDKRRTEIMRTSNLPATVKLQLTEVASQLGIQMSEIELADVFNYEILTVQDGEVFRSNAALNAAVVCAYNPELVTGSYRVVSGDWGMDGSVTITPDPEDPFVVYVDGLAAAEGLNEAGPLKMVVNSLDYSVVAEKSLLAEDLAPWGLPYTGYSFQGFGELNTCDGTYTMTLTVTVDQGSFGAYTFVFTKN